jgi:probable biosynthetic protein (TIGR04098 family)
VIEEVELTLSHVDLGSLDELAAMTLFGTAHSHHITAGTGGSIRDIVDADGRPIYPGYYWTHLVVPDACPLETFAVWDRVAVGVDVRAFGPLILASTYALARPGQLDGAWDDGARPYMRAGTTFYLDGADPRPSVPRPGTVAALPRLAAAPPSLDRFRQVKARGDADPELAGPLVTAGRIPYELMPGRDIRAGHNVMFSRYVTVADAIEQTVLGRSASLRERETFYLASARAGRVHGGLRGRLDPDGVWTAVVNLYDDDGALLVTSRVRKQVTA